MCLCNAEGEEGEVRRRWPGSAPSGHAVLTTAATTGATPSCSILARRTTTVPGVTGTLPEALHLYVKL